METLNSKGSVQAGDALFKTNCVGCHGITARGLVGPDLHSITNRLNDKEIIKQVLVVLPHLCQVLKLILQICPTY